MHISEKSKVVEHIGNDNIQVSGAVPATKPHLLRHHREV